MNEYMIRMLRENGINGLKLIPRIPHRPQDRTDKTVIPDVLRTPGRIKNDKVIGLPRWADYVEGDFRRYSDIGYPAEDYCIDRGDGSPLLAIREVQTQVEGMKKYALIEVPIKPKQKLGTRIIKSLLRIEQTKREKREAIRPVTYAVRYVYSEGIEIERMSSDEEYAQAVISLLKVGRLTEKEDMSYRQMGTDIVYIGTIGKTESGYEKVGIKNYMAAVSKIDAQLKDIARNHEKLYEEKQAKERKEERKLYMKKETRDYDRQDWIILLERMIATYGAEEARELLEEAKQEAEQTPPPTGQATIDEEEYYW